MSAANLLTQLRSAGVKVEAAIDLDAPAGVLTEAMLATIRKLKPDLLRLLTASEPTPDDEPTIIEPRPTSIDPAQALIDDAGEVLSEWGGATVLGITPASSHDHGAYVAENPSHQLIIDLLAQVYRRDPQFAYDLLDAWQERIAIVAADEDCKPKADEIALAEVQAMIGFVSRT